MLTYSLWVSIGKRFLTALMSMLTPFIREALETAIQSLYDKAKSTDNIVDDKLIEVLAELLNIKLNKD